MAVRFRLGPMTSKQLGNFGEKIAERYLKNKGYKILDKNYSPRFVSGPQRGEIDIIAKKDKTIVFAEVKTLSLSVPSFYPEQKVDYWKQRKIIKAAESWLMEKKIPFDSEWRIDIVAIRINPDAQKAKIHHFQNIG